MKPYLDILNKILEKSHDGMDIIVGELPQAEVCIHNVNQPYLTIISWNRFLLIVT